MTQTCLASAYAILGVTQSDDFATIKAVYKRLVREHHPDVAGGDSRKLVAINEAYDALRHHKAKPVVDGQEQEDRAGARRAAAAQAAEQARQQRAAAREAAEKEKARKEAAARAEAAQASARKAAEQVRARRAAERKAAREAEERRARDLAAAREKVQRPHGGAGADGRREAEPEA